MITSSNIVEFFELYLRPFLEQESRLTKELAADEAIAVYDDPVVRSMDGYEAAGRIRQYEKKLKRKHLPIIALTANVFAEDSERALRAGMDAHMGKPVEMPPKELEVLYYLASHPNMVFTRDQLLEQVWGYNFFGDSRTVDVHIKRLREKLPDCEKYGWEIHTVWRVGYKFDYKPA